MTYIPVSQEVLDDSHYLECMFFSGPTPTEADLTAGEQTYPHGDHEHTVLVGWRFEEWRREQEAKRDAEMAACPFTACTCGWHDEE